jgi:formate hydrogenlyase transcriptional activator
MNATSQRYRALLDVSDAVANQPTIQAVLHSLRAVLSKVAALDGLELYLLSDDGAHLQLFAFDRAADLPQVPLGTELPRTSTIASRILDEQTPVYLPDLAGEMEKMPELAPFAGAVGDRNGYLFPVSTSRKQYGALLFGKHQGAQFPPEDLEVMSCAASHVAVALESTLATARAEDYQRDLARERDRLRLLLEINNHVASKLDTKEVFLSASASIRSYFHNDFSGVWLVDRQSNQIQSVLMDFPTGKGLLDDTGPFELREEERDRLYRRHSAIWSATDIARLHPQLTANLRAESISSMLVTPLATANGVLGLLTIGSRKSDAFGQEHLDLLTQISAQISLAVENAVAYGRLNASAARLEEERLYLESEIRSEYNFEDIVGKSAALRKVLEQISIVAPTDSTVLLHGETGTGKELVARALHSLSPRRDRTFVRLNCAAIPSGLVESELFGHERGAFTGALMQKRGRFELADKGSLFLDEIGDITMELQPKLLRALQEREFERLGSAKTIRVDVRLIAATHRDLPAMIRDNDFREDLFYRLNVFPIEVPPLRERREDIPLLVHFFVGRLARKMQKRITSIPKHAMDALTNSSWHGNIRELENFVERCVILTNGDQMVVPLDELRKSAMRKSLPSTPSLPSTFHDAERQTIINALRECSGRISGIGGAAERLGLRRTTLQNKMRRLNISRTDYNSASQEHRQ